jgi:nitroreductase
MDTHDAIFFRRSITKYTDQPAPGEMVNELLKAAMAAPSAGNAQACQYIVLRDRSLLGAIPKFHSYSAMLKYVAVAILVCGDLNRETYEGYWVQDSSAATQNPLLAATAKGLGAVWTGVYPREDRVAGMRSSRDFRSTRSPCRLSPSAFRRNSRGRADRFDASRVHKDRW